MEIGKYQTDILILFSLCAVILFRNYIEKVFGSLTRDSTY